MTVRLLTQYGKLEPNTLYDGGNEAQLVMQGIASTNLAGGVAYSSTVAAYKDGAKWQTPVSLKMDAEGDKFFADRREFPVYENTGGTTETDYSSIEPTRGGAPVTAIQFRGAADTAASLGTIGLVVNASSDTAAGNRLAATDPDWSSEINGASPSGRTRMIGPVGGAITRVHIGQLGLTAPLTDNASGPVLAASNQMTELNFDAALNVTSLLVVEGGPTNYAGASGTGSARYVTVYGLSPVVA